MNNKKKSSADSSSPGAARGKNAGPATQRPSRPQPLDKDADVSAEERTLLERSTRNPPDADERAIHEASLEETDEDGTPLEEKGLDEDLSGDDLDVPGSEDDDADEEIGEEDEEN